MTLCLPHLRNSSRNPQKKGNGRFTCSSCSTSCEQWDQSLGQNKRASRHPQPRAPEGHQRRPVGSNFTSSDSKYRGIDARQELQWRSRQNSHPQHLGLLTGQQGLPRQQAGVGSSSAPTQGAPQPSGLQEGMERGDTEGLVPFGARCHCTALGDAPECSPAGEERGRAPDFPEEETP